MNERNENGVFVRMKERKKGGWIGWINESVNEQWIDSLFVSWMDGIGEIHGLKLQQQIQAIAGMHSKSIAH